MICVTCLTESCLSLSESWLLIKGLKKREQVLLPITSVQLVRRHRLDAFRCKLKAKFALTYIVWILRRSSFPFKIQVATHPSLLFWSTLPAASCPSHEDSVQSQLHKWHKEGCAILRGYMMALCHLYSDVHLLLYHMQQVLLAQLFVKSHSHPILLFKWYLKRFSPVS